MMHATLSFNGLLIGYPALFDGLQVPPTVNKEDVVNNLLLDTYDLEVMISSGPVMARALEIYSKAMLPSWTRLAKALAVEYDPLNTDEKTRALYHTGSDDSTRTPNTKTVRTLDLKATRTPDLVSEGSNSGSDSTTREVTGFDSDQLQVAEKNTTELGTGNRVHSSGTDTTTNTGTDTTENSGQESTASKNQYTDTETTKGRAGRSAQSLVSEELDLAKQNTVEQIVSDIKQKFCLLVY